jgi:hypothetical protein
VRLNSSARYAAMLMIDVNRPVSAAGLDRRQD